MQILHSLLLLASAVSWLQPMEPLVSIARENVPGNYELCNAVAISPECAVTLCSFSSGSTPFLLGGDSLLYPDTVILFRDMGLSLLRFPEDTFSSWRLPSDVLPEIGSPLIVVGQSVSGIVAVQAFADSQTGDGAMILSTGPYSGLMGAPVFDLENRLVGIVTGVIDIPGPRNVSESRIALLPAQLWYMWAQLAMFDEDYTGPSFGVTAMSFTCTELDDRPAGILLISVTEGSPAWSAGLRRGDLITRIDGMRVYHPETLRGMVITSEEPFTVEVLRDGDTLELGIDPRS
jgi:membrane-associated protease RseP (regulator of RpoE activity)